jgi:hypothetical protein
MKLFKYTAVALAALVAVACQKEEAKTQAVPADGLTAPVLNAHANIIVDEATLANEVTFSWSAVDYGYPAAVSYGLFAVYGDSEPYQIGESYTTSYTLTKEVLNNALVQPKGLAVPEDTTSTVFFYVTSGISSNSPEFDTKSAAISVDITTIKSTSTPWIRRPLYIAGNFQGWAPDKGGPVIWETEENSDVYEGLVHLGDGAGTQYANASGLCEFKFCVEPSWTGNLGGTVDALTNADNPANITTPAGLYWVSVKLEADHASGSVKLTPVTKIGAIGTAVGSWDVDLDLSLDGLPTDPSDGEYETKYFEAMRAQTWSGIYNGSDGGEFKFRLNGAWDTNWGGADLGHLTVGGDNCVTTLTGNLKFAINFRGDVAALAEDSTNPSPISASVTQVE